MATDADIARLRRHRAIFESAVDFAIIATGQDGAVTDWNSGAERIFGWSAADIHGQSAHRLFTDEDRANGVPEREMGTALAAGRANDERWMQRRSGAHFWAAGEMMPLRDEAGTHIGFLKILRDRTDEHRAVEALQQSEAWLRRAQAAGGVGLFSLRLDDSLLVGTPEFCRMYGVPHSDIVDAEEIYALVHPDDEAVVAKAGAAGERLDVEYRIRRADTGEERWISREAELEYGPDGAPLRLVGIVRDVTERRAAQRAVEESAAQFRAFAQAVPNHVWTAPPDGQLDWFNDRVYEYSGAAAGELDGQGWAAIVHPDDIPAAAARWAASLFSGETYETEFRLRRHDGVYRWHLARAVPIRAADGSLLRWIGTNTDIEDQKEAVRALAGLNETLARQVAERTADRDRMWRLSTDIMLVTRFNGIMMATNPAWQAALGWTEGELIGRNVFNLIHPDDIESTSQAADALESGMAVARFDNRLRHRDGSYRWITWAAVPGDGLINAVGRDFTAEREQAEALAAAQEALRQSQKMEAVGQLTGGLAHDFNNLLTGIAGSLELLQARIAQGRLGEIDRYVTAAQGAARRAAALTHRLLAFSRRQTLDPRATDMNRLVADMEELIRRTVGPEIAVEVVAAGGLWTTLVDPNQLENALLNLCLNARDAMPTGGNLTVETANRWLDGMVARNLDLAPGQYVSLCVSDNGAGMTPEVAARAFDPFFTTKPIGSGTGLGLSMIYGFVRQSGGQARIYSEPGRGTMVCLYLPRHRGPAEQPEAPAEFAEALRAGQGESVLIVDDEPTVRMLVTEVLQDLGYTAIEAADGAAGLRVLQSEARVDLLVTDVGLPGGMNGRQLADAGRALRPGLRVLFITGYAENAVISHGHLEHGMHVLTKPFAMEALALRIKDLVSRP